MNINNEISIEVWRIPYEVFENSELKKLDITLDEFDLGNYEVLKPSTIRKLSQLEKLSLTGIWISRNVFQNEICNLINLQHLTLMYSEIDEIPKEIENLKKLKSITLRGNNITSLPDSFSKLQNVTSINLIDNSIHEFPLCFSKLPNLKSVDLRNNPICKKNKDLFNEFGYLDLEKYFIKTKLNNYDVQ